MGSTFSFPLCVGYDQFYKKKIQGLFILIVLIFAGLFRIQSIYDIPYENMTNGKLSPDLPSSPHKLGIMIKEMPNVNCKVY